MVVIYKSPGPYSLFLSEAFLGLLDISGFIQLVHNIHSFQCLHSGLDPFPWIRCVSLECFFCLFCCVGPLFEASLARSWWDKCFYFSSYQLSNHSDTQCKIALGLGSFLQLWQNLRKNSLMKFTQCFSWHQTIWLDAFKSKLKLIKIKLIDKLWESHLYNINNHIYVMNAKYPCQHSVVWITFHICLVNMYCWREAGSHFTGARPYLIVFNKNIQQIWKMFALQQTARVKEASATAADNSKGMKRQRDYPDSLVELHHFVSCWIRVKDLKVVKSCLWDLFLLLELPCDSCKCYSCLQLSTETPVWNVLLTLVWYTIVLQH